MVAVPHGGCNGLQLQDCNRAHQCFMLSQLFISHGKGPTSHHTACSGRWLLCQINAEETAPALELRGKWSLYEARYNHE